ncbi:SPOC like C-terminal domain-containing protein [Pyronema domesticum]|uniref:ATP-dependent DNA helicase II subunit 1 n=1 Tax=Pyronema omphalodes (strain CBS 100304) TaxID=1076935 RepID=U4L1V4_PYROM|nr:SPOC like C-terminal domain-containing protein [Pyronema domesticum]CCX09631.1 Similar to ATP-dependent DNA helicase II subunit 1; acc. no. Q2MHH4 [Pyronema omphalodes CBS 100304]
MATKWRPEDDEINEEEEEEDVTRYQDQKDAILFAIHVTDSMLIEHNNDPQNLETSAVRTALQCAYSILQERIISNPNDMMGILLFGTEKTRFNGHGSFNNCYLLMDLDVPDAASIKELKNLLEDEEAFEELMVPCQRKVSLANVLFGVNQIFTIKAPNFQSRKLFLITDEDDPHANDKAMKNSAITRGKDLYDLGVQIEPFFMNNPGREKPFDTGKFYDDIIYMPAQDEEDKPLAMTVKGTTKLKDMVSTIRSKATLKRAQFSIPLELGPGMVIGVKGYVLFKRQERGRSHFVYTSSEKPQIVSGTTTLLAESTAQVVEKAQTKRAYKFGGSQIAFTEEEMKEMRNFGTPGIRVIGFKPASAIKFDHPMGPSQFIYPDEKDFIGSTRTFTALYNKLMKDKKVALVWAITRKNSCPIYAYLSPSEEVRNPDTGAQTQPPGFFLIQLPFADDVRQNPEVVASKAPGTLIDKMRVIAKTLNMPKGYEPEKYQNPSLQWHYRILQAIALEEDMPENPVDKTLPKYKAIHKHVGKMVLEWGKELGKVSGGLSGGTETLRVGTKRKAEEDDGGVGKKAKAAVSTAMPPSDAEKHVRLAYKQGALARCTVQMLRGFLDSAGVEQKGRLKAQLIQQVEECLRK